MSASESCVWQPLCIDVNYSWRLTGTPPRAYGALPLLELPFCVGGAGATPPEDCGGVSGYEDFVRAMADVDHPEHGHLAQWIGAGTWDPAAFDSIEVNDRLARIKL